MEMGKMMPNLKIENINGKWIYIASLRFLPTKHQWNHQNLQHEWNNQIITT